MNHQPHTVLRSQLHDGTLGLAHGHKVSVDVRCGMLIKTTESAAACDLIDWSLQLLHARSITKRKHAVGAHYMMQQSASDSGWPLESVDANEILLSSDTCRNIST